MDSTLKRSSTFFVKITLFCGIFAIWKDGFFNPCLSSIYEALPTDSTFLQTFVLTGPALVSIPFILLSGILANSIGKKNMILIGSSLYIVGNAGCAFVNSMEMLAVVRAIGGIGSNIVFTMLFAIMPEVIPDETENARIMGVWNVACSAFGAAASLIAGIVCQTGWRNTMLLNLVAVITLLTSFFFLPKDSKDDIKNKEEQESAVATESEVKGTGIVWFFEMGAFLVGILGMINFYYPDLFVSEHALGTSVLSGAMGTGYQLGSIITALVFSALYNKIKKPILFIMYGLISLGYLILMIPGLTPVIAVTSMIIGGAGMGISNCFFGFIIARTAPAAKVSLMVSIWSALNFTGIYICSHVPYILQSVFKTDKLTDTYLYIGIILLIVAAIFGTVNYRYMKSTEETV